MSGLDISILKGMELDDVIVYYGENKIEFIVRGTKEEQSKKRKFKLEHLSECCEDVYIESIVGDIKDLIGAPITLAEMAQPTDVAPPESTEDHFVDTDSFTWTFYKLATIKGYVDIRFFGSSNGYYSEEVDFIEVMDQNNDN